MNTLSSEYGACKTGKARFWLWRSGSKPTKKVLMTFLVVPSALESKHHLLEMLYLELGSGDWESDFADNSSTHWGSVRYVGSSERLNPRIVEGVRARMFLAGLSRRRHRGIRSNRVASNSNTLFRRNLERFLQESYTRLQFLVHVFKKSPRMNPKQEMI